MGLMAEIRPFMDGNGLVAPCLTLGAQQGSDNGPMYTSELIIMLARIYPHRRPTEALIAPIRACIDKNGMLRRTPYQSRQTGPDDYYGVLAMCKELGITDIPRGFLKALIRNYGFLNNQDPGVRTGSSFLVRQPWLIMAMVSAAFPSWKHPGHILLRLALFPFYLLTALIIATSCIGAPLFDTDARRLNWHLIQAVAPVSVTCIMAALLWDDRLLKHYGPEGMKQVAKLYYRDNHPFGRHWRAW